MRNAYRHLVAALFFAIGQMSHCDAAPPPSIDMTELRRLAKTPQPNRGALWTVQHGEHTAYLYGTVHIGKLEWMFPGPIVKAAFGKSTIAAFEIDITDPELPGRIRAECKRLDETAVSDISPPERLTLSSRISELLTKVGIAENMVNGGLSYKELQLELRVASDLGLNPAFALETSLTAVGKATGKTVIGLESVEAQASALYAPDSAVRRRLQEYESGVSRAETIRLTQDWESGNLDDLEKLYFSANNPDIETMVIPRNKKLATAISELLKQNHGVFISIGILHMVGATSILSELQDLGYTVERIKFD